MLALLGTCGLSGPADARRIPVARLVNTQVPANGVLRFSAYEGVTVRVLAPDGSEVPGQFLADGVWRPDVPFTVGTYMTDLTWETNAGVARDEAFEVVPAIDPASVLVSVMIESRVDADFEQVLEQVCCLAGVTQPAEPCDGACPPLCVPTLWAAKQTASVYGQPASSVLEGQIEIRETDPTEAGVFTLGYWEVEGAPDELCGVVEVFSWLDESTKTISTCIPNPKPELKPIEEPVTGFNVTPECTIPPVGYEALWCDERQYTCEESLPTLVGEQLTYVQQSCEHYAEVCQRSVEGDGPDAVPSNAVPSDAPPTNAGAGVEATSSDDSSDELEAQQTNDARDDGEPMLRSIEASKGGCTTAAATRSRGGTLVLVAGAGLAAALVRRRSGRTRVSASDHCRIGDVSRR